MAGRAFLALAGAAKSARSGRAYDSLHAFKQVDAPPPLAYLAVLRELTRNELDVASGGAEGVEGSAQFERFFVGFVARNLAIGGLLGLAAYSALRPQAFGLIVARLLTLLPHTVDTPLDGL